MPLILNKELYEKAKQIANETYKKPSAYKSAYIVKQYKQLGENMVMIIIQKI
jgi:hypothetical protein